MSSNLNLATLQSIRGNYQPSIILSSSISMLAKTMFLSICVGMLSCSWTDVSMDEMRSDGGRDDSTVDGLRVEVLRGTGVVFGDGVFITLPLGDIVACVSFNSCVGEISRVRSPPPVTYIPINPGTDQRMMRRTLTSWPIHMGISSDLPAY